MKHLAALALLAAAPLSAQEGSAPSLAWLHGEWQGSGTLMGRPATMTISSAPVLIGSATALTYRAEVAAEGAKPSMRFEGRGTYRIGKDGRVTGNWSDSAGNFHPLAGRLSANTLTITWGEARTEIGQSRYELGADGALAVTDTVYTQGEARAFARGAYWRK